MRKLVRFCRNRGAADVALALLLCIVLAEGALRLVLGLGSPVLIVLDKGEAAGGYGYIPAPDQDVRRFFARNKINHFSMRSDEISETKTEGHARVLFIGDSVTYGTTHIDQSRIFTSLVAEGLPQRIGRPADVLNASAGGWAPGNEVGFLRRKGTFDADAVLIVLNTSDLGQAFAEFQPNPSYPTEPPLTAIGEVWTRYIVARLSAPDPGATPAKISAREASAVLETLEIGRVYSLAHKARLSIVYVPSRSKDWDGPDFQDAKRMLMVWAKQNEVPLIDLTADFASHSRDELYLERGDGQIHLAEAGHRVVAARLLSALPAILKVQAELSFNNNTGSGRKLNP